MAPVSWLAIAGWPTALQTVCSSEPPAVTEIPSTLTEAARPGVVLLTGGGSSGTAQCVGVWPTPSVGSSIEQARTFTVYVTPRRWTVNWEFVGPDSAETLSEAGSIDRSVAAAFV